MWAKDIWGSSHFHKYFIIMTIVNSINKSSSNNNTNMKLNNINNSEIIK